MTMLAAALCLAMSGCVTLQRMGAGASPDPEAGKWDTAALDTGRSVAYLSAEEKNVVLEINKARTNPALYAETYLAPMVPRFRGNEYRVPGKTTLLTEEGAAAVRECMEAMKAQKPVPALQPMEAMTLAARDHVKDVGPKGVTGHTGSDGSDPSARAARYAKGVYGGENISYGYGKARDIVIQFLVDDGVPSRGHRANLMSNNNVSVGVAIGPHKTYGFMCVLDFAWK